MPSVGNVKGALLEELILHLLSNSGYSTVKSAGADKTLLKKNGMLWVKGRGEWHQIDAIADYRFSPPFSNPQRLLVEGKCESRPVSLGIVRNSVGVHKDVSEFFVPDAQTDRLLRQRYHYQCAIFSGNGFSPPAQNYAYAQDVFLLNLNAGALKQVVANLNRIQPEDIPKALSLPRLREHFRRYLEGDNNFRPRGENIGNAMRTSRRVANHIGFAGIAMVGGVFPIFLVPDSQKVRNILIETDRVKCRIHIAGGEFQFATDQMTLFHFSIPDVLFRKCFDRGEFDQTAALEMKLEYLNHLEVSIFSASRMNRCTLTLDTQWLDKIRRSI